MPAAALTYPLHHPRIHCAPVPAATVGRQSAGSCCRGLMLWEEAVEGRLGMYRPVHMEAVERIVVVAVAESRVLVVVELCSCRSSRRMVA